MEEQFQTANDFYFNLHGYAKEGLTPDEARRMLERGLCYTVPNRPSYAKGGPVQPGRLYLVGEGRSRRR